MNLVKKLLTAVIALVMMLGMSIRVYAQEVDSGQQGTGSITIDNAAKGETYAAYLLFKATLGENGEVAYIGTVPSGLEAYFEETSSGSGYVQATKAAFATIKYYTDASKEEESDTETEFWTGEGMSDGLKTALTAWKNNETAEASAVSNGSPLTFTNLELGYYVVTTTQGEQLISVDTTMPAVSIIDKNTTTPTADKEADGVSYSIGDTITYTATFNTANYIGDEQVKSYTISDTLPEFLTNVQITSVVIVQSETDKENYPDDILSDRYTVFDEDKKIVIPWVDDSDVSLYKNGSVITITYTAELTDVVNVNADNKNTITITPNKDKDGDEPFEEEYENYNVIKTYAAALKKTDGTNALAGAKFAFNGLSVERIDDGVYMVVSYDPDSDEPGDEMEVGADGKLYIIGLAEGVELEGIETVAPAGYNKLTDPVTLEPQVLEEEVFYESGTRYYDEDGNLIKEESSSSTSKTVTMNLEDLDADAVEVKNQAGTELPSTGGMGTTIFYTLGGMLVLCAGILLVSRRRMSE